MIKELDLKYGKLCHKISSNILHNQQDAEECVNDAYLGIWNRIPPERPNPLLAFLCKIVRNLSVQGSVPWNSQGFCIPPGNRFFPDTIPVWTCRKPPHFNHNRANPRESDTTPHHSPSPAENVK
ncbi:MAG: hypothetical protein K2I22_07265 [Lachnospiraceae bacterium]|nr:hypothetical protein [Lachnospiraceae bacterium]